MTKPELIEALNKLSIELNRELDITGTIAELEQRVREGEEELQLMNDDPIIETFVPVNTLSSENKANISEGIIKIKAATQLHLRVRAPNGSWISKLITKGQIAEITSEDFDPRHMQRES